MELYDVLDQIDQVVYLSCVRQVKMLAKGPQKG